ncbi:MAG: nuclear transport factor 2 family protein [Myxococcota bacterium]|jgi:hypothetical protein
MKTSEVRFAVALTIVASVAAASLIQGCPTQHQDTLGQLVWEFNKDMRWKRFQQAGKFMPYEMRTEFVTAMEKEEGDLNITDYEIKEGIVAADGNSAVFKVRITWYKNNEGVEKKGQMTQNWKKVNGNWVMASLDGDGPWKPELAKVLKGDDSDGGGVMDGSAGNVPDSGTDGGSDSGTDGGRDGNSR